MIEQFTADDRLSELKRLEDAITGIMEAWMRTGRILAEIRHNPMLWREEYGSFEVYCAERWGLHKATAYRLINACEVLNDLTGLEVLPKNERQVRALWPFDSATRRLLWLQAVESARNLGRRVTGQMVEDVVALYRPGRTIKAVYPESPHPAVCDVDVVAEVPPVQSLAPGGEAPMQKVAQRELTVSQAHSFRATPVEVMWVQGESNQTRTYTPAHARNDKGGYWMARYYDAMADNDRLKAAKEELHQRFQRLQCIFEDLVAHYLPPKKRSEMKHLLAFG